MTRRVAHTASPTQPLASTRPTTAEVEHSRAPASERARAPNRASWLDRYAQRPFDYAPEGDAQQSLPSAAYMASSDQRTHMTDSLRRKERLEAVRMLRVRVVQGRADAHELNSVLGNISEFTDSRELRSHILAVVASFLHADEPVNTELFYNFVRFAAFPMEPDTLDNLERIYQAFAIRGVTPSAAVLMRLVPPFRSRFQFARYEALKSADPALWLPVVRFAVEAASFETAVSFYDEAMKATADKLVSVPLFLHVMARALSRGDTDRVLRVWADCVSNVQQIRRLDHFTRFLGVVGPLVHRLPIDSPARARNLIDLAARTIAIVVRLTSLVDVTLSAYADQERSGPTVVDRRNILRVLYLVPNYYNQIKDFVEFAQSRGPRVLIEGPLKLHKRDAILSVEEAEILAHAETRGTQQADDQCGTIDNDFDVGVFENVEDVHNNEDAMIGESDGRTPSAKAWLAVKEHGPRYSMNAPWQRDLKEESVENLQHLRRKLINASLTLADKAWEVLVHYANDREVPYDAAKSPVIAHSSALGGKGASIAQLSATRVRRRLYLPSESVEHMLWICGVSHDMEKGKAVFRAAVSAEALLSTSTLNAFVAMLLSCGNIAAATSALSQWDTASFAPDEVTAALAELIVAETNEREQQRHVSEARTAEEITSFREKHLEELFPKLARFVPLILSKLRPKETVDNGSFVAANAATHTDRRTKTLDE